jgi:hypothetical protein
VLRLLGSFLKDGSGDVECWMGATANVEHSLSLCVSATVEEQQ